MSFEYLIIKLLNGLYRPTHRQPRGRDLVLGVAETERGRSPVIFKESARTMHLAVLGLSGVGKTYFLEALARQDIDHGTGFVLFDVHGDLADAMVAYLAGKPEIRDRLILVEPFDPTHSVGFNPLEQTPDASPFFQAQELASILHSRWEAKSFGARTEELLRSALYTLSANNLTMLELPKLLVNPGYRRRLLSTIAEPAIADYWRARYDGLSERMQAVMREPILTRVSGFLSDPQIRHIVGQPKSTFSFCELQSNGKYKLQLMSNCNLITEAAVSLICPVLSATWIFERQGGRRLDRPCKGAQAGARLPRPRHLGGLVLSSTSRDTPL